jgi:hypothetical protein
MKENILKKGQNIDKSNRIPKNMPNKILYKISDGMSKKHQTFCRIKYKINK